jgi:hypothetical protein
LSRITEVSEHSAGPMTRAAFSYVKKRLSKVPTPMKVIARHPWIFRGYSAFEFALEKSRQVEPKLKSLASIKAATLVGCPF